MNLQLLEPAIATHISGARQPRAWRIARLVIGWFAVCLFATAAFALDSSKQVTQYAHTAWMIQDGFFRGSPFAIAQTKDGYLWVGTRSGLLRFDGVRFVPWSPGDGERLLSLEITRLLAAKDGSLWIGTRLGLSHWKDQKLTNYPSIHEGIASILQDDKGTIWFTRINYPEGSGPLCRVLGPDVRCYGKSDGIPPFNVAVGLAEDAQGNFWIGGDTTLLRWKDGAKAIYQPSALKACAGIGGILGLAVSHDGTLWAGIGKPGPGLGLERLVAGQLRPFVAPGLDGSTLNVFTLLLDHEGVLWVGTADQGIYRIYGSRVEHFGTADGLSSDWVTSFAEDHEGNLWVATSKGVDRFSDTPVVSFSKREGLGAYGADSVLASRDGSVWVGGESTLTHLRNGTAYFPPGENQLQGHKVTSMLEDHTGRLWVGIDNTLTFYEKGVFHPINRPDGSPIGLVVGIAEDREDSIWVEVIGPPKTLLRIQGLQVQEEHPEPGMPAARRVAADPTGGVWLGLYNGDLAHYQDGKLKMYRYPHNTAAQVHQLLPISSGSVLAATSYGVIGWREGNRLTLTAKNGLPCDAVYAMTFDDQGNLWLFMECELAEITNVELRRWWSNPEAKLSIKTLDVLDGVRAGRAPFVAAARSSDGRLWFANGFLVQMLDPAHLSENKLPPPVHIEQIVADRKNYAPANGLVVPPLSRDLQIDYTGLSFVAPQKVYFRYKLEGRDKGWQEPGTRRQAFYSDLSPGKYRFHVIASNNDGVWNEEGATLDFSVAPAWYQTIWFRVACVGGFVLLLWALYQLRLKQIARQSGLTLEARVEERTRIARDLHDTLLQSFNALLLRLQAVSNVLPAQPEVARERVDRAIEQASDAITEGRDAVLELRSGGLSTTDLSQSISGFAKELLRSSTNENAPEISTQVEGTPRDLNPMIRDEAYRIASEALRNAILHSGAARIEVEIRYDEQQLRLRVRDEGKGIEPSVLNRGCLPSHWGLRGMRERAKLVGGNLEVWSQLGSGTEVELTIPASNAYAKNPTSRWSIFSRTGQR
jgi:signal transduction histidine kinase/ligand-binding sensor domain-containing protein